MADYVSINRNNRAIKIAVIGSILIVLILVVSTLWMVQTAKRDNEIAVKTVSLMYLDELAGRREQVVDNNLQNRIRDLRTAVGLMDEEDLSDLDHLQVYQSRMKQLYVLAMSRIESGRMTLKNEEFSFSKLLETINVMISGQCNDKGVEYQCHISPDIEDYYVGDNVKIRQVLINVLGNAVKFTPEGGQVSLDVKRKAHYDGHSTIEFTVADTGIGISENFMPHLFDTFAQEDSSAANRYGSSGLGLAITKNIVEMMNGDISAVSTKGKGTTFTIVITLDDAEPVFVNSVIDEFKTALRNNAMLEELSAVDLTGRHILLAEDVDVNAEIMMMVLSSKLQAGLDAHLSKPVQPESLFETLELYIGKREKENEKIQND
ncbi:MAG: hypothetical protein K6A37_06220 [Saccharofermentans sp.]|nr:hypothetical protein [Saccharofermentans sp.]